MFGKVAGFEFRYQTRQPIFWVTIIIFALLTGLFVGSDVVQDSLGANVHRNSPFEIGRIMGAWAQFYMLVTAAFVGNIVIRDDQTGFGQVLRPTRISKFDYLFGRFTGAFLAVAVAYATIIPAFIVATFFPWIDRDTIGPLNPQGYAFAYFVIGIPALFLTSAVFFALATVTRSMMGTYIGVIVLFIIYLGSGAFFDKPEYIHQAALFEPFGEAAQNLQTRYWTPEERNTLVPTLSGELLVNRAIWTLVGFGFLALASALFRFESRGAKANKLSKEKSLIALANRAPTSTPAEIRPLTKPRFTAGAAFAGFIARTRLDMAQVFKSPAYFILMALGLALSVIVLLVSGDLYGTEIHPVTRTVIGAMGVFSIVPLIVSVYYSGELVWRERERRVHEIIDATPAPDWAFVFPKVLAISLVLISTILVSVVGGIAFQTVKGFTDYQIGEYLLWYVLPRSIDFTLLAVLAVFIQTLSSNKFLGWGVTVLYVLGTSLVLSKLGFEHNLYHYGGHPIFPLSDMNGQGQFWKGAYWFRSYWSCFALVLVLLSFALWPRGADARLSPRLKRLPRRLAGAPGVTLAAALAGFAILGGWIYVNTNVWNEYRTDKGQERYNAEREKLLRPYVHLPEPSVTDVKLDLDLYPHELALVTRGSYALVNRTGEPLKFVHVLGERDLDIKRLDLTGAHLAGTPAELAARKRFNFRLYKFDTPLAPGQTAVMTFTTERRQRGFTNAGGATGVVDNGTFVNNAEFAPAIGVGERGFLTDRVKRRNFGLKPAEIRPAKLEDDNAKNCPTWTAQTCPRARNALGDADWVNADITVTTDADQTPIAPGYKVSDVTRGGRRTAEFKTDAPILHFFSVQSGRYAEKHEMYKGIDIAVYYDRQHPWNVGKMIAAARAGLDYYQANFGPYQFRQFRFIEFPDYAQFAQSFANTVPWSEGLGFIADLTDPTKVDYVTYVGAHELGHQWWAHQEISADMQGGTMLVETLAQYSALMVMEKVNGPDQIKKFLKFELDNYLRSRGAERVEEEPLDRVENQPYIHYRKGALVMYLLKDQIGEEAVNRALREFLAQYKFKSAPYPASKDLVALFRKEAPADKQQLITDLFEKITIYDVKSSKLAVKKRSDGKYDVALTVEAHKMYFDGKGKETKTKMAGEVFDIGLFAAKPNSRGFGSKDVILMQKAPLKEGGQTLRFVVDREPKFGGADPYNKWIDRNSDDNVVQVGG